MLHNPIRMEGTHLNLKLSKKSKLVRTRKSSFVLNIKKFTKTIVLLKFHIMNKKIKYCIMFSFKRHTTFSQWFKNQSYFKLTIQLYKINCSISFYLLLFVFLHVRLSEHPLFFRTIKPISTIYIHSWKRNIYIIHLPKRCFRLSVYRHFPHYCWDMRIV